MQRTQHHTSNPWRLPIRLLWLVVACVALWTQPNSASASTLGQCMDFEALLGIASTDHGRHQAEQLVRQNHPYSSMICVEMGWHCGTSGLIAPPEVADEADDDDGCHIDEESGRCKEPDEIPESFAGDLLADDDEGPMPLHLADACFEHPTRCGALPAVPDGPQLLMSSTVPSVHTGRSMPDVPQ
ncbi:MAG: hypothetical protein AAFX99_35630, partial [Myxococcota bacterium]